MSESNPPNQIADLNPPAKQPLRANGKIICPVCRSEILQGEVVCWVCYGGQTRVHGATTSSTAGNVIGSIFAGIAISLGSIVIGMIIAIVTIFACIESFFRNLGCAGLLLATGCLGWTLFECFLAILAHFFC